MQDAQYRELQGWIRAVQPMLLLGDWEIWLEREKCVAEAWAACSVAELRDTAWISVAWPNFFDEATPEDQRLYLAHEMVHILIHDAERPLLTYFTREGDGPSVAVLKTEWRRGMEVSVHRLARLLAPMLPLPCLPRTQDQDLGHQHDNAYPTGGASEADWQHASNEQGGS